MNKLIKNNNTQKLNGDYSEETKTQIKIANAYKKLYNNEKLKTGKLLEELKNAYFRIDGLQEQCVKHGMLHEQFQKQLDKYDY